MSNPSRQYITCMIQTSQVSTSKFISFYFKLQEMEVKSLLIIWKQNVLPFIILMESFKINQMPNLTHAWLFNLACVFQGKEYISIYSDFFT